MSDCCTDPTEPAKLDPRQLLQEQQKLGNLLRDLFTDDPERVILKQLQSSNTYLTELAALNAYHESVRKAAIDRLTEESISILERIVKKEQQSEIGLYAEKRLSILTNA